MDEEEDKKVDEEVDEEVDKEVDEEVGGPLICGMDTHGMCLRCPK